MSSSRTYLFKGTNGKEVIDGTNQPDHIYGRGGDDLLWGLGGNDYLNGGAGNDRLFGQRGSDYLVGGAGNDVLDAFDQDNAVGGAGNDIFYAADYGIAIGGSGNDRFIISNDRPSVLGGAGVDVVEFDLLRKNFKATYVDDALLLRTHYDGFYKPEFHWTDRTIEKVVWKDSSLTLKLKSDPTITSVHATDDVDPGGIATTPPTSVSGVSDPFARIRLMSDGVLLGTCVANHEGKWLLQNFYNNLPDGHLRFTVVADYGKGIGTRESAAFDFELDRPLQIEDLQADQGVALKVEDGTGAIYESTGLGDVNGDGISDVAVTLDNSRVAIVYGSSNFSDAFNHMEALDETRGFVLDVGLNSTYSGVNAIFAIGDCNADGFDDFSYLKNGEFTIVYGSETPPPSRDSLDRATLTENDIDDTRGFKIQFSSYYDGWGLQARSVGDVNGDGRDDLLVGLSDYSRDVPNSGRAFVLFGGSQPTYSVVDGRKVVQFDDLEADDGFEIGTTVERQYLGRHVAAVGDINGDGLEDFMVSATHMSGDSTRSKDYVVFGSRDGFGTVADGKAVLDLPNLSSDEGFVITGNHTGNTQFSGIGDFNGDGYDDFVISTPLGTSESGGSTEAYLVFGGSSMGTSFNGQTALALASLSATQGVTFEMSAVFKSPRAAGDFNGDGFDDFVIHQGWSTDTVRIVFGRSEAMGHVSDGHRYASFDDIGGGIAITSHYWSGGYDSEINALGVGDVNDDGFDDIMLSRGGGETYILFGYDATSSPVTQTGTAAAEILHGGAGDDVLNGNGGADIFRAGAGNDLIRIGDADFRQIRAGRGTNDTVEFAGSGITLDTRDFGNSQLRGIEAFDLTGTGNNTLILTAFDVFRLSPNRNGAFTAAEGGNSLVVSGDDGDTLQLIDHPVAIWTLAEAGIGLDGSDGGDFDVYNLLDGARILASVAVGEDVTLLH